MKAKKCFYKTYRHCFIRFYTVSFFLFLVQANCFSQYWIQQAKSITIEEALSIAADAGGNTYSTGYFTSSLTIDSITVVSGGVNDVFIAKTDGAGIIQWIVKAGGLSVDKGLDIAADANGNIAVTGYFSGTATFGSQTVTSSGQQDIFIAKYNSSGVPLWVQKAGGSGTDVGNGIKFDSFGNILVTGEFRSASCAFGSTILSALNNSLDVFTAKYDGAGNFLWAKKGSGKFTDRGTEITTDATGNVYVAGEFSDTITFDVAHYNATFNSLFLIKYDSAGQEQWFRWMGSGSLVSMGGLAVDAQGNIIAGGNYYSSLIVLGLPSTIVISNTYPNNFFITKFDSAGSLIWSATNGSDNAVDLKDVAINSLDEIFVSGNFKCRFNDFADQYGQGTFCSVGYWDCFVAHYSTSGTWNRARNFGGKQNDYLFSMATDNNGLICTAGSFANTIYFPENGTNFLGYGSVVNAATDTTYCGDSTYFDYASYNSNGNIDAYIGKPIDFYRQPMDYFDRTGTACVRNFKDICIDNCIDTVAFCGVQPISVSTNTVAGSPDFTYLWNTGDQAGSIFAPATGIYSVTATTQDGCFSNTDSIFVLVNPLAVPPLISDSKGFNVNSPFPTTNILICLPDSVTITASVTPGYTFQWGGFAPGVNPITVSQSGSYSCVVTNQSGCSVSNAVNVVASGPLSPVVWQMVCETDDDHNDTISLCENDFFTMFIYDTISNPLANGVCPDYLYSISWNVLPANWATYNSSTDCNTFPPLTPINYFSPDSTGLYTIEAWVTRKNSCDSDSFFVARSIYVIVDTVPATGTLIIFVSGDTIVCPGDSVMLVATGGVNFGWNTGDVGDTIYVSQPGYYYAAASDTTVSASGCQTIAGGYDDITITFPPQPTVVKIPANGILCPGDSLALFCDGSGSFTWYGPNGTFGGDTSTVYALTTGTYFCIRTFPPGCQLVSNTITVTAYNTPVVIAAPLDAICNGQPVTINLLTDSTSIIQWLPPLSGSAFSQTISVAGTYSCNVTSCGITTPLVVVIDSGYASAVITGPSQFCQGDSVLLSAVSGMASYSWQPLGQSSQSIYISAAGQYNLFVTDSFGCTANDSISIQDVANTLVPPFANDTSVCSGLPATLIASGSPTINWFSSSLNLLASGNNFITPPLFSNTIYYLQTDSGVCKSAFDTVTVIVNVNNSAAITATGPATFCLGDSVLLTANGGMTNYLWQPTGQTAQSIYANSAGNYFLYTYDNNGCEAIDSIAIQTISLGIPVANDTSVCAGFSVVLNATGSPAINWYNSNFNLIASGNSYTTSPLFANTIFYLQSDSGGCQSGFDSVTVIVNTNNSSTITASDSTVFCQGDSVMLIANSGMINYLWQPLGQTSQTIYATASGNYYLYTYDANGCEAVDSVVVLVVVNNLVSPFTNDTSVCEGFPLTVYAYGSPAINWYNNSFVLVSTGNSFTTPPLTSNVTYYLQSDSGVCLSAFDSLTVTVNSNDSATITAGGAPFFCDGDSVLLTANSGMTNYLWQPYGETSQTIYASQNGNYFLFTYDSNGCLAKDSIVINVQNNNLNPPVVFNISVCPGLAVTLYASGTQAINWFDADFNFLIAGNTFTTPPLLTNTTYYLQSDDGLCKSSFAPVMVTMELCDDTLIIPNVFTPNGDGFNDLFPGIAGNFSIKIYNRWGNNVFESNTAKDAWKGNDSSGNQLSEGTYFYIINFYSSGGTTIHYKGNILLLR